MNIWAMQGSREQTPAPTGQSFRVLRWQRTVNEVHLLVRPGVEEKIRGEGTRWHFHSAMELTWFERGSGVRFVGDHIGSFVAEDLVLLGPGVPHYWHVSGESRGVSLQWDFPSAHPFWSFPEARLVAGLFRDAARGVRITGGAAQSVRDGILRVVSDDGVGRLGELLRIFGCLSGGASGERSLLSGNAFELQDVAGRQRLMGEAVRYLLANFRNPVRLERLLEITGMSKSTFSRQFLKHSGKTFQDFLLSLRIQAACRELKETRRPVLDVAVDCGFSELSFFNRCFRRAHGCTPTQFRSRKPSGSRPPQSPKGP
jgi:AraC-like DNA-binding protein